MTWYLFSILIIIGFLFMEFMAWFTHKFVMHGFLWVLHKDHHVPHKKKLEKNDWFALFFSVPAIVLVIFGIENSNMVMLSFGIGISAYGLAYFLFHDVYVHKRLRLFNNYTNRYLKATVKAHHDHHKPNSSHNFGFLIAPLKYYKEEFSSKK